MTIKKEEIMKITSLKRSISIEASRAEQSDSRVLTFSFSSEQPVERYFGTEILSHKDTAVDLARLNNSAPLLFNHDQDQVIGVIEKAWIKDGKSYCEARFSKSEDAQKILNDINDEILRNVSVGYQILEMELTKQDSNGNEYTATRWMPYEVSIVAIPADPTIGIGRAQDQLERDVTVTICIEEEEEVETEESETEEPSQAQETETNNIAASAEFKGERKMDPVEVARTQEKERILSINALGRKFNKPEIAESLIANGKTIDEARAAFLEVVGVEQKPMPSGEVGLSRKEIEDYSFVRAINAMMNPGDRKAQEAAEFERKVSIAAAEKSGKAARGFMVPVDVLRASFGKRDLTVGSSTAGGNSVATNLMAMSFIELLRNKSVLQRAGVTVMNGLVGNIAIPRQIGGSTAYWVAESGSPTESQQTIDQVTMSPKTVGAYTDYSRKLMLQSSIDVESFVRNDLAQVLALEIDRAGLYGSGSANQPLGLKGISGLNTKDFTADVPTFAEVVELESKIASANADVANMKYLMNAAMRGSLKTAARVSGYPSFILENGLVNGYAHEVSNQIEANDLWFGNWADLIIGFWSGLDLLVDPYTGSTSGTVRVVAHQDVDVAARHPASFTRGNNTL